MCSLYFFKVCRVDFDIQYVVTKGKFRLTGVPEEWSKSQNNYYISSKGTVNVCTKFH